jgi:putative transcriptional regulator
MSSATQKTIADLARRALVLLILTLPALSVTPESGRADDSFLAGKLLVAQERLDGSSFERTVILLFDHDSGGAFGLTLNRPVGRLEISDFLDGIGMDGADVGGSIDVYSGGPVQQRMPFLIHSDEYRTDDTSHQAGGAAITLSEEILRAIGSGEGPVYSRLVLGYAGWAGGQLEGEIARGSWHVIDSDPALIFETPPGAMWRRATDKVGIEL